MNKVLLVAIGGAIGAVTRHLAGTLVTILWPTKFPLGTWLINITGSFIIGCFLTFAGERAAVHPNWRLLIAVGFVGAYTTFSTFEYETFSLIETGRPGLAGIYVILSVTAGFIAVWAGINFARQVLLSN